MISWLLIKNNWRLDSNGAGMNGTRPECDWLSIKERERERENFNRSGYEEQFVKIAISLSSLSIRSILLQRTTKKINTSLLENRV